VSSSSQKKAAGMFAGGLFHCRYRSSYAAEIALTGQVSTQAPQSMQVSASMLCLPLPSAIAFTGHESTQAPQLVQSLEIT
jgi:hypothetical protein